MKKITFSEKKRKGFGRCFWRAVAIVWLVTLPSTFRPLNLQAQPPLRALLVTGQNFHNWQVTSAALKQILENTGLFQVEIAVSPPSGAKMESFRPNFSSYELVVLDYSGDPWPRPTQKAFVDFVKKGGGVVVYHSANNTFANWQEYNEIIGLGGWGNRNEKTGPYVYWKDGRIVHDPRPGLAGYHTPPHPFLIINRELNHPITAGLPERWMHADDELYCLLRGPAKNLTVLATAYSAPERAGTGRDEPVLFTVTYGAGRVFHTVLGHASGDGPFAALECVGFIVTFQRGAEWAATGRVTQKIPADFPGTDRSVSTPADVRRWPGYQPPALDSLLSDLARFEHSKNEEVVYRLRDYVRFRKDSDEARQEMESKFLAFLESSAPPAAKMEVCRHLRLIGGENSIPVLARMLLDEATTDMARFALEKIPGEAVDRALLDAFSKAEGEVKLGIISSLGARRSECAVAALGDLLSDPDRETARAAATALAAIGSEKARGLLVIAFDRSGGEARETLASCLLSCAEKLRTEKTLEQAFVLSEKLSSSDLPVYLRQAALREKILASDKEKARRLILESLRSPSPEEDEPAIGLVGQYFDDSSISEVCSLLSKLPTGSQVMLLSALADYSGQAVAPAVLKASQDSPLAVRLAALQTLAKTGDASLVPFLAERAATTRGPEQEAARSSLWSLPGSEVDDEICLSLLSSASDATKTELIKAIGARCIRNQKALLFELMRSGSPANRREAARAVRCAADREDLPLLLDLFLEANDEALVEEMVLTISALCQMIPDPSQRTRLVEQRIEPGPTSKDKIATEADKRARLFMLLGRLGNDSSLPLLRAGWRDENPAVVDAVVRSLADWPTPTPRHDLLLIARKSTSLTHRVLAVRGYVRMVGLEKYQSPQGAVHALELALQVIERPEELKLVLGALADFPCPEALRMAESFLGLTEVKEEARVAADAIKKKLAETKE